MPTLDDVRAVYQRMERQVGSFQTREVLFLAFRVGTPEALDTDDATYAAAIEHLETAIEAQRQRSPG